MLKFSGYSYLISDQVEKEQKVLLLIAARTDGSGGNFFTSAKRSTLEGGRTINAFFFPSGGGMTFRAGRRPEEKRSGRRLKREVQPRSRTQNKQTFWPEVCS